MAVSGYSSTTSVVPGDSITFHLSSDSPGWTNLTVERVGTSSVSATITAVLAKLSPPAMNPWEGFGWPDTVSFNVPSIWPTGLYRLAHGADEVLTFVVRSATPGDFSKILLQVAFLTPTAYNSAGDKSLYGFNSGGEADRASQVSLDRPGSTPPTTGDWSWETKLIRWLETEGIEIEYCSSIDLHAIPNLLSNYECLVIGGHDEYWTKLMRDQVERFVSNGGNLIVLSGNTCYGAVRLEQGNRLLVFHKYAVNDPKANVDEASVKWTMPPLNRPQNSFLGVGWTEGAYGGPPAAYEIRFPMHWVFAGVANALTSSFMGYETDAAEYVDEPEGYPRVTGAEGTPLAFTVLASADLRSWIKPGRATMGIYSRNGTVFNAATTDWINALNNGDSVVEQVTLNVFSRLKQRIPWDWEPIGQANFGCALASLNGKLFITTTQNRLWMRYPIGADVVWRDIGHANNVVAMAGSGDTLFAVTSDNNLWWRPPVEVNIGWTMIGTGVPVVGGTKAMSASGGMLYAVDTSGVLWTTPASRSGPLWRPVPAFAGDSSVNAMTSYGEILFASTTDNRLLRYNRDLIKNGSSWELVHHCNYSIGLAVVEWMLFVATTENLLWRIDLYGLR